MAKTAGRLVKTYRDGTRVKVSWLAARPTDSLVPDENLRLTGGESFFGSRVNI